jgi:Na+-transporting methylmalonyl-CoA/oxaloacetate decarboxylase gamma subunit
MGGIQQMVIVSLFIFIAGLIYHAGQLTQRVSNIERTAEKMYEDLREDISELTKMVRAAIGERRNWRGDDA